jgi:hypothetical protein
MIYKKQTTSQISGLKCQLRYKKKKHPSNGQKSFEGCKINAGVKAAVQNAGILSVVRRLRSAFNFYFLYP